MLSRKEEAKGELARVRRELNSLEGQIDKICKELEQASKGNDSAKVDDARITRNSLWREREHLREQETIFLRSLFVDPVPAQYQSPLGYSSNFAPTLVPLLPRPSPIHNKQKLHNSPPSTASVPSGRSRRPSSSTSQTPLPLLTPNVYIDPSTNELFGLEYGHEGGYEVNRSSDCKVMDVWREWKEGIQGGPAIERLEEERKRDRKKVWWRHKNDYKYWSKQMRIIHAIEEKSKEFGHNVEASLQFWEEILRVEFEGSISKLREALGGDKQNSEQKEMGVASEMAASKRQRKELLQQGLERLKGWPVPSQSGLLGSIKDKDEFLSV